ncbi:lipopolysaccharide biosynthesis protein [Dysgonomonas sp.]|uniref:lipopolysaccharide biosynthesis protein n=1 Tax=Dysgonomonas sp. TaxID=1891233 RepID=UPI0027B95AC9|nr:oligosaccharide flippase family protein [Dysgonomonas sp.]
MEDKKRLGINLVAQLFEFIVGFIINFFLAPFVIAKLGAEAYGFIGLANNFVSYTTLITIALNSMAARFITVSFHRGDTELAKKYFASVYYSNLFLAIVIALFAIFIVGFLNYLIQIPPELVGDVKLLFGLTFINSIIALTSNVYSIATFVKNRLDLSSLRNIVSNLLRVLFIITPFLLFVPHLWYYGISAIAATLFIAITNRRLTRNLLPGFKINKSLYDFKLVKELIFSGVWNLFSKLSEVLSTGIDLLLANLFISATAMGTLSISKAVPIVILSLCSSIAAVFAPKLTELYAKGEILQLKKELLNNIRIMGILSALPLIVFLILGEVFFQFWVPTQDANRLSVLSSIAILSMLILMPIESLWNIFTITNKVKQVSITLFIFNLLLSATIFIGIFYFDSEYHKLLSIVVAHFIWGAIRGLTYLPIYGAKCLGLKWYTFYPLILKILFLSTIIIISLSLLKRYFIINNWLDFILYASLIGIITTIIMGIFILQKNQKAKIIYLIKQRLL